MSATTDGITAALKGKTTGLTSAEIREASGLSGSLFSTTLRYMAKTGVLLEHLGEHKNKCRYSLNPDRLVDAPPPSAKKRKKSTKKKPTGAAQSPGRRRKASKKRAAAKQARVARSPRGPGREARLRRAHGDRGEAQGPGEGALMSTGSKIEWTNATWNPVRGCSIVSKGCTNCYAMKQAHRFSHAGGPYAGLTKLTKGGPVWTGTVRPHPELLDVPLHWKKPRRIFVNSMSDLFHDDVPDEFIAQVWLRMGMAPQHTFQILTKRPERMCEWVTMKSINAIRWGERDEVDELERQMPWPLPNVWLGVSVEDQAAADERIPLLLKTPAAVRWISAEPLVGQVKLKWSWVSGGRPLGGGPMTDLTKPWEPPAPAPKLDWVVAGGESGPGARPMHPDWARMLRDQCEAASVSFFFKQWGGFRYGERLKDDSPNIAWTDGKTEWYGDHQDIKYMDSWLTLDGHRPAIAWPCSKAAAGRQLDGRQHDEYPI